MSNLTRPMTHLLDFKMAPKNVYFIIKLWSTYCILQTALLKVVQVHREDILILTHCRARSPLSRWTQLKSSETRWNNKQIC